MFLYFSHQINNILLFILALFVLWLVYLVLLLGSYGKFFLSVYVYYERKCWKVISSADVQSIFPFWINILNIIRCLSFTIVLILLYLPPSRYLSPYIGYVLGCISGTHSSPLNGNRNKNTTILFCFVLYNNNSLLLCI